MTNQIKTINVMLQPRIVRLKDAPGYMGTNINYFNENIRPDMPEIRYSKQSIGFDRVDLDHWVEQNKGCDGKRPNYGGNSIWDEKEYQGFINVKVSGTSTNNSSGKEFVRVLTQVRSKKLKNI